MPKQDVGKDSKPFQSLDLRNHVVLFHFNIILMYPVRIPGGR